MYFRSGGVDPGRDGCRVPMPWSGTHPPFGFAPSDSTVPWLPQPASWADYTVEAQSQDPGSMLSLYRAALRIRRDLLRQEEFAWLPSEPEVLAFSRGGGFVCIANLSGRPIDLPEHHEVLLGSTETTDGRLSTDSAAWLRIP
jgi:alpha-glucosidase